MRLVATADIRPHHCLVFPHLGAAHPKGYIDTGNDLYVIDPHGYISVVAVEEMAKLIQLPTEDEWEKTQQELENLRSENQSLHDELQEVQSTVDAIKVIERREFKARKRPGRKPKQPQPA
jgi:hypothetical protein